MILTALLVFASIGHGQNDTLWTRTLFGTGDADDRVVGLAADSSGSIYALVHSIIDDTTSAAIAAKYSPTGQQLWSRRFVGNGYVTPEALAVSPGGDVVIVGTLESTLGDTAFALKYTASGDSAWTRTYNLEGNNDRAAAVIYGPGGDVYVAGYSETDERYEDMMLLKYTAAGALLWVRHYDYDECDDYGLAVLAVQDGSVYVGGSVCDWRGGADYDMEVLKYDAAGTLQWARKFEGPGLSDDSVAAMALDPSGNLLVAGCANATVDSGGYILVKYSSSGDTLWSRVEFDSGGRNSVSGLAVDGSGGVLLAANQGGNSLLLKYGPTGTLMWQRAVVTPRSDSVAGVVVDGSGNAYVTGWVNPASVPMVLTRAYSPSGDSLWACSWQPSESKGAAGYSLVQVGGAVVAGGTYERTYDHDALLMCLDLQGTQQWQARLNGPGAYGRGGANAVAFDREGNLLLAGWLENTDAYKDLAVAKFSRAGDLQWLRTWGGVPEGEDAAVAMAVDTAGYVYVVGYTQTEAADFDYVTARYTPAGALDWLRTYNGPGDSADVPTCMALDGTGGVVVAGKSAGIGTNIDFATLHYNAAGQQTWLARYNGADNALDMAEEVVTDGAGATYVAGRSNEEASNLYGTVIRYDTAGNQVWLTHVEDPDSTTTTFRPVGMTLGPSGDLFVGGYGGKGYVAARLDTAGDTVWTSLVRFTSDHAYAAVTDRGGRTYVTGYQSREYRTVCFGPLGEVLWSKGTENLGGEARAAALSPAGHVAVTGENSFFCLTIVYDTLGTELWADTLYYDNLVGNGLAYGDDGRLAVALGDHRWMAIVLYEPHIGIAEPLVPSAPRSWYLQALPSLFSRCVSFSGRVDASGRVLVKIVDATGRVVGRLECRADAAGSFLAAWDGRDDHGRAVPRGVYFAEAASHGVRGGTPPLPRVVTKLVKAGD